MCSTGNAKKSSSSLRENFIRWKLTTTGKMKNVKNYKDMGKYRLFSFLQFIKSKKLFKGKVKLWVHYIFRSEIYDNKNIKYGKRIVV